MEKNLSKPGKVKVKSYSLDCQETPENPTFLNSFIKAILYRIKSTVGPTAIKLGNLHSVGIIVS